MAQIGTHILHTTIPEASLHYVNIVADSLITTLFPAGDGVYQQDNALCYKGLQVYLTLIQ